MSESIVILKTSNLTERTALPAVSLLNLEVKVLDIQRPEGRVDVNH
jgi:hypothetical protein